MSTAPDFGSRRDFYTFAPEQLAAALPDFTIVREVGQGSMGIVYEARSKQTGERRALKVLPPSLTLTERALARFLREGRIMARIRHPDIVGFYDQGSEGRLHWFVMEFVDGVSLEERLRVGPMPLQNACAIGAQVARALQFAHEHGVIHRDIKPGNLMLRQLPDDAAAGPAPLTVAITDFGLARETGTGSMTESGALVGTPMYMAPEVVLGGSAQASTLSDVYSLGATLYTLVTGQPPFDGPTAQSVLKQVLEREPVRPSRLRADLPAAVEAVALKAMAKEPSQRYGSAQEFADDLERFLRGERVLARRPGPLQRGLRFCARRPLLTLLSAVICVLLAGGLLLVRANRHSELQACLADAERFLALAATARDEQDRPRSPAARHDLLQAAVAAASAVIASDEHFALAWFLRAKANHRLRQFSESVFDLDTAERLLGEATPELLLCRIDSLRQQGDRAAVLRLQQDLTTLLRLDPSPHTRALVAEHLLEVAEHRRETERSEALQTAASVLQPVGADDPRAAVARARILELSGEQEPALAAMRACSSQHEGDAAVHLQAAAMFERLGHGAEGMREQELARLLEPRTDGQPAAAPLDLGAVGGFLGDVNRMLQALDRKGPAGADKAEK